LAGFVSSLKLLQANAPSERIERYLEGYGDERQRVS